MEEGFRLEECPLQQTSQYQRRSASYKGPLRVVRLCLLGIALPTTLISLPLYLRYRVYADQLYPFAVSDMRLVDRRISTVWCQKQLVKVNASFNAFLLSETPPVSSQKRELSMVRDLVLGDDMKEYWGFYLLNGTTVTVSTCVRWPGASMTVIRGHKHLHDCAYIGDDSSEELDELLEAARDVSNPPIAPKMMKRHRSDVHFHNPGYNDNHSISREEHEDLSDTDPALLKQLLSLLNQQSEKRAEQRRKLEVKKMKKRNMTSSEELYREMAQRLDALGERKHRVLQRLNNRTNEDVVKNNSSKQEELTTEDDSGNKRSVDLMPSAMELNSDDEERDAAIEEGFNPDGIADHRQFINETTLNDRSNSEFWSSFSSSEEALLNCEGLILNLPLTPHHKCESDQSPDNLDEAALTNTITYLVPRNGYYFFIFNSENEVQTNYIRVRFHLNKTMYDVTHSISSCSNTEECSLDLGFFSEEKVVVELPVLQNESRWNEEFIVVSECQPRTFLYMSCVLSVPVLILFFAFQ